MLKWLRSLLTGSPSDFDGIKSEVERILELDLVTDASRQEHEEFILSVLRQLDAEIENISNQANGYPANPISAHVWLHESESPHDEDRLALESLSMALQRLVDRGVIDVDGIDLLSLQSQTDSVLSRPAFD